MLVCPAFIATGIDRHGWARRAVLRPPLRPDKTRARANLQFAGPVPTVVTCRSYSSYLSVVDCVSVVGFVGWSESIDLS